MSRDGAEEEWSADRLIDLEAHIGVRGEAPGQDPVVDEIDPDDALPRLIGRAPGRRRIRRGVAASEGEERCREHTQNHSCRARADLRPHRLLPGSLPSEASLAWQLIS